ncbi:hypothetical protein BKA70DRAFT_1446703 [Coprinopsis sp. MPI-PUGE-AT-0042]|nr:hypothetical protein BKA70DRAFT_1446703 [Coprinopsis sp. MPI-PUGE-AT-0042]
MDFSSQNSRRAAKRPSELNPCVLTNITLPPSTLSELDGYLATLLTEIEHLEDEITKHQVPIATNSGEISRLWLEYCNCANLRNLAPRMPQEILGVIFSLAVDTPPFNRYIDVAHLRGVCLSWRRAALTTPGLWTGLTIVLDKWRTQETLELEKVALLCRLQRELKPWLAIVSHTGLFHLTLTSYNVSEDMDDGAKAKQTAWIEYLLSTTPRPGFVTLASPTAVTGTMSLAFLHSTSPAMKLEITEDAGEPFGGQYITPNLHALEDVFPDLQVLIIRSVVLLLPVLPFHRTSLRTLHLSEVGGDALPFHRFLQGMPSLRELKLSFPGHLGVQDEEAAAVAMYEHQKLEILVVTGEYFLSVFRYLSFPCLRFLGICGANMDEIENYIYESDVLTRVFTRPSSSKPLLVSLSGIFFRPLLAKLIDSLPPHTHLHLDIERIMPRPHDPLDGENEDRRLRIHTIPFGSENIEAVICGEHTVGLWWLQPVRDPSFRPLKIILPADYGGLEADLRERDQRKVCRFVPDPMSNDAVGQLLLSLAPHFSESSASWWECDIVQNLL